jgi:FkbM family methyltransferase
VRLNEREIRFHVLKQRDRVPYRDIMVPLDHDMVPWPVVKQLLRDAYEVPEIEAVMALVRPDDRIVELGSGLGVVSTLLGRAVPEGRVVTVEANPGLQAQIRSVHEANGVQNVERLSGIVTAGTEEGTTGFFIHKFFPEGSQRESELSRERIEVPLIPWGRLCRDFAPTFLLCDIEGGEAELLPALEYGGIRVIVVELHPAMLSKEEIRRIFARLIGEGFVPRVELSSETVVAFERVGA